MDSPARAPDPEHLKAVWSQTSNKAGLHPVNSLEGIADDLTALPFTLQDVKSEDGETPPPSLPTGPWHPAQLVSAKMEQWPEYVSVGKVQHNAIEGPLLVLHEKV